MKSFTVKKLAEISGVSVRTLHYYDQIGLLSPKIRTEKKYRLYGNDELLRLQQILFFREMDFQLKDIIDILDEPEFALFLQKAMKYFAETKLG
ncbi:MAG: MerR family transcriptional regulator [Fermentimonas sp.]|nr:MerR family transcriptional regulator [Fermentimonas sp.]